MQDATVRVTTRVTVAALGNRGDGRAEGPDGPIHVRRALPGELVEGSIKDGRMDTPRVLVPSSERVRPPCPHAKSCGGCQLQHLAMDAIAGWKVRVVAEALARHGLKAELRSIATSPPATRRRARFSARRTKSGTLVGFMAEGSHTVVDTPACHLVVPALLSARGVLDRLAALGATRKATLSCAVTACLEGLDIDVSGGRALDVALHQDLAAAVDDHGVARLTWAGETIYQQAQPTVAFDGLRVPLPPGAFLQATADGEHTLRSAVMEIVGGARRIVDLFSGCGTFALPLTRQAEVHAVEGDRALLSALHSGWRGAGGLKTLTVARRNLFTDPVQASGFDGFQAAVIDPPRAGAAAQTTHVAQSQINRVALVSCNPTTFARDAELLTQAGFRLAWVQVIDQFLWSPHIEVVGALFRDHMPQMRGKGAGTCATDS